MLPKASLPNGNTFDEIKIPIPAWTKDAECRKANPELFYTQPGETGAIARARARIAEAKAYCAQCPMIAECLEYASKTGDNYAIMGGLTPDERRSLEQKRATSGAA